MRLILTIAVYLLLCFALGIVAAFTDRPTELYDD